MNDVGQGSSSMTTRDSDMTARDSDMTARDSDMTARDSSAPMETVEDSVVCKNTVSAGNVVYLHPLVAMNIADHATRYKISNKDHQYGSFFVLNDTHYHGTSLL